MTAAPALAIERTGGGVPVLMIHGLGGTSNTFQPLMAALAGYRGAFVPTCRVRAGRPCRSRRCRSRVTRLRCWRRWRDLRIAGGPCRGPFDGNAGVPAHRRDGTRPGAEPRALFGALTEPPEAARERPAVPRGRPRERRAWRGSRTRSSRPNAVGPDPRHNPAAVAFVRESILRQPPEGYARNCEALAKAQAVDGRSDPAPALAGDGGCRPGRPGQHGTRA